MLLHKMELSGSEFQDEGSGRKSGSLTFTMEFIATAEGEIPAMYREFNEGRPTLAFWEGIEYGSVQVDALGSPASSPIAVSVKQNGSPAVKTTLAVQPGTVGSVEIPVTVMGPDGPLGGMLRLDLEARPC